MLVWRSGQFSQVPEDEPNWESSWGYNKTIHPHGDNIPDSKVRQVWCGPISSNLIRVQDSKNISTWKVLSLYGLVIYSNHLFSKKILRIYFDPGIHGICSRSLLQFSKTIVQHDLRGVPAVEAISKKVLGCFTNELNEACDWLFGYVRYILHFSYWGELTL